MKKSDTTLVICGTNAYSPLCREYSLNPADGKYVMDNEFRGYQSCPFDPKQSSTHLQADGELYVGTISDFASQDAMISRPRTQFRTPRDTAFFNGKFLGKAATEMSPTCARPRLLRDASSAMKGTERNVSS